MEDALKTPRRGFLGLILGGALIPQLPAPTEAAAATIKEIQSLPPRGPQATLNGWMSQADYAAKRNHG